jgi:dephospho-CoA kinase
VSTVESRADGGEVGTSGQAEDRRPGSPGRLRPPHPWPLQSVTVETPARAEDLRPLLIGITGNIGTGKSTVAQMLAEEGAAVIDADKVAHEMMRAGTPAYGRIVERFGPEVVGPDGQIDRRRLGALVFSDPQALARLDAIVHPATLDAIQQRIDAASAGVVVVEAIKLIEAGMADICDRIWVTTCRPEQQISRIMQGRGLSRTEAQQRVQAQSPQEEKIARADVVLDTSDALSRTRAQVQAAWGRLMGEMPARTCLGSGGDSEYNCSGVCSSVARSR